MSFNIDYRINKAGYIVCDSIAGYGNDQCIKILAAPSKRKPGEYISLRQTRQEDLDKAIKILKVVIHPYTKIG